MANYDGVSASVELKEDRIIIRKKFYLNILFRFDFFVDFLLKPTNEVPLKQISTFDWREPNPLFLGELKINFISGESTDILFNKKQRDGLEELKEKLYSLLNK
jgi:hypothetical protein